MAEYLTNTEDMSIVANAIRAKGGTDGPLEFPQGMAQAIADIPTGGGGKPEQECIDGLIVGSFPSGSIVTDASTVNAYALASTKAITNIHFTAQKVNLTGAVGAFMSSSTQKIVFDGDVVLAKCKEAFSSTLAKEVVFSKNVEMGWEPKYLFQYSNTEKISFGSITGTIDGSAFSSARKLSAVIIKSAPAKLASARAFIDTLISNGTGYIYVPKIFVDQYKVATNWVQYADQIRAIEDYPEITGG